MLPVLAQQLSPLGVASRRREAGPAAPVIASFSQSGNYGGVGVAVATVGNMSDGIPQPFAGLGPGPNWLMATLEATAFVSTVTLGASTNANDWGAPFLNTKILEVSLDGTTWTDQQTLSGFVTAAFNNYNTANSRKTLSVNADCRYIRVKDTAAFYLSVGEFTVA